MNDIYIYADKNVKRYCVSVFVDDPQLCSRLRLDKGRCAFDTLVIGYDGIK